MRIKIPFTPRYLEIRSTLANPAEWLVEALVGNKSASGRSVTPTTAMQSTAVFACVRVLAETVASLPLHVYRRLPQGGKEKATEHYLYPILHDQPNPEMTSLELRETLMGHLCLWGNAYCEIARDAGGRVRELWPLRPDKMTVKREEGELRYYYQLPDGTTAALRQQQVLHIRGLGGDGVVGYSPIRLAREAIGLALATEEFGARFFGDGAHPGGIVEYPGKLSDQAYQRYKESVQEAYGGLGKAHRLMVLEEGLKYTQVGIPPEDAQFLQTRRYQLEEIARIYRVPPHMVGDLERSTYSNIEHQSIEFVVHTIRPYLVRWEQAIKRDLIPPAERQEHFAEFLVDGLLRGDIKSRYEAYAVGRQNGWLSADDIRELENMNPLPDGQGKVYLVPLNMIPASSAGEAAFASARLPAEHRAATTLHTPEERRTNIILARRKVIRRVVPLFRDLEDRLVGREVAEIRASVDKRLRRRGEEDFIAWLDTFYRQDGDYERYAMDRWLVQYMAAAPWALDTVEDELGQRPDRLSEAEMERFVREYTQTHVRLHLGSARGQLRQVVLNAAQTGEEPAESVEKRLKEWEETRADKTAQRESVQAINAFVRSGYLLLGVRRTRWNAMPGACPYCAALDGKVAEIEKSFLSPDSPFEAPGADGPLTVTTIVRHPPAHEGCQCVLTAGV